MVSKCDVCQRERQVAVASYPYGAISFAYCIECLQHSAYPKWALEATLLEVGGWDQIFDGFGEDNYYFENGEYYQAKMIPMTKERIDTFWKGFQEACDRVGVTDSESEETI
jgi:hypothetical protein